MIASEELKSSLLHTWPAFFARHGNFTLVQRQAIPPILAGCHTLVIAATAAGKTEAALAPLLERHLFNTSSTNPATPALRILYLCPTRALVRDLYERLRLPLQALNITLSMKSGDTGPVSASQPPTVLITTPESTDALLTRAPRLFTTLCALVLDEIHLFDHSPRGDHLRCLLWRIESIQRYHQMQQGGNGSTIMQRVALSATVPDPQGVAQRYLLAGRNQVDPQITRIPPILSGQAQAVAAAEQESQPAVKIVEAAGNRKLLAEVVPMYGLRDLVTVLTRRAAGTAVHPARKTLIFCNTRNEVEQVASYLRQELPYAAEIFVHYSNLDPAVRLAVEERFAAAPVALCVSTSTLELGIDIGSIDEVTLIGPPPTLAAFLQRLGRGGRRRDHVRVLCLARSALEEVHFQALIELAQRGASGLKPTQHNAPTYHFRPSVLVQQIFSSLKQSPTGALRLADLRRIAPAEIDEADLRSILAELTSSRYLQTGRPGEWRAAPLLQELVDQHEIYSNIGSDPFKLQLVDAYTGQTIAQTDQVRMEGETLRMGGQVWLVVWRDRYRIGIHPLPGQFAEEELHFVTQPFAVPLEVGRAIAAHLQLAPNALCQLHEDSGVWLFHFWGDLYGQLLAELLQAHFQREDETALIHRHNAHCLRLPATLTHLPPWDAALAQAQLQRLRPRVEPFLELGRFHALLPSALAERTVLALCELTRFEYLYRTAIFCEPSVAQRARLQATLL